MTTAVSKSAPTPSSSRPLTQNRATQTPDTATRAVQDQQNARETAQATTSAPGNNLGVSGQQGGFSAAAVQNGTRAVTGAANPLQNMQAGAASSVTAPKLTQGLGNAGPAALSATIGPKSERLDSLDQRIGELTTKKAELTETLAGIELTRGERFMGGAFAGVFGGETSNLERREEVSTERNAVGWDLREAKNERRELNAEINKDVANHLEQSGDPTFQSLQSDVDSTGQVFRTAERFEGSVEQAVRKAGETEAHQKALTERETKSPENQSFEARNYNDTRHRVAAQQMSMALTEAHSGFNATQAALKGSGLHGMKTPNTMLGGSNPLDRVMQNRSASASEIASALRPVLHEAREAKRIAVRPYSDATNAQKDYVAEQRASAVAEFAGQ